MTAEETVQQELEKKFPALAGKVRVQRARRIFVDVEYQDFRPLLEFAIGLLKFPYLCVITGLDEGDQLGIIYHMSGESGIILSIKTRVPMSDPKVKTVTDLFPSAEIYEREMVDLLGAKVEGLQAAFRYPLTDDWPTDQFPLRKSWKTPDVPKGEIKHV